MQKNSPPSLQLPLNTSLSTACPENKNYTQHLPLSNPSPNQSSRLDIKQIPDFTMDSQLNITGNIFAVTRQIWYMSQCCGGTEKRYDENSMACHHFHNFTEKIFQKYETERMGVYKDQVLFINYLRSRQRGKTPNG